MMTKHTMTDCRSEDGITTGIIDAVITLLYLLTKRDLKPQAVSEALKDLKAAISEFEND